MAKKKRGRPRPRPQGAGGPPTGGGANLARRERKEEARQIRERARRRAARRASTRRGVGIVGVAVVALLVATFITRAGAPKPLSPAAKAAAEAAGCDGPKHQTGDAPGGIHITNPNYRYPVAPATYGPHLPTPVPNDPAVHQDPLLETRAVHFLEHAGIILYYRQSGTGAVGQPVIDALAQVANTERNTLLAPYPSLPAGQDLAFTTWNTILTCPNTITPEQAKTVATGFVRAYVCSNAAPEPRSSPEC
jgi:hypothetical protein